MTFQEVSRSGFFDFELGAVINNKKRDGLSEAELGKLESASYMDPVTGSGFAFHVYGEDNIVARAWNNEAVVEYRGGVRPMEVRQ